MPMGVVKRSRACPSAGYDRPMTFLTLLVASLGGCAHVEGGDSETEEEPTDSAPVACEAAATSEAEVVHLTTSDDVVLEADYYAARADDPAVLLLHMIPPSYDRTSWSPTFIQSLRDRCFAVLALDRRGAGGSEGTASQAYQGVKGVRDAQAAAAFLVEGGAGPLHLVGASNGTATALDYGVDPADGPAPASMVFWSPDTYTEANSDLADLSLARLMFTFPASERDWSESQRALDPGTWTLHEYEGSAHGTNAFGTAHDPSEAIVAFLAGG